METLIAGDALFGPALGLIRFETADEAIASANGTNYGLPAAVFTENRDKAKRFARDADSGNIDINRGAQWRPELMPYGGLKESGFGKEGPR